MVLRHGDFENYNLYKNTEKKFFLWHSVINQKIIKTLTDLNKGEINYKHLKLVSSDGVPYAVKVGKLLKSLFDDLKHVTCFCHMLHRICEFIRSVNKRLDYFIVEFKRFFNKNK